jgi:hypothetical protein
MGGKGSGRWAGRRHAIVEECERQTASTCPLCGRRVRFVYLPSFAAIFGSQMTKGRTWACRHCHRLHYLQQQVHKTRSAAFLRDPLSLLKASEAETQYIRAALRHSDDTPPNERREAKEYFRGKALLESEAQRQSDAIDRFPMRWKINPRIPRKNAPRKPTEPPTRF